MVVNDDASDEQLDAIDRIMRGQEGGPFEMFASLYGNYLGTERGEVTFSDGDTPSFSIRGNSFTFEPLAGPGGQRHADDGEERRRSASRRSSGSARRSGHSDVFDIEYRRRTTPRPPSTSSPARWPRAQRPDAASASTSSNPWNQRSVRRPPPLPALIQVGLVGALLVLAGDRVGVTNEQMAGMDAGPGHRSRDRSGSSSASGW